LKVPLFHENVRKYKYCFITSPACQKQQKPEFGLNSRDFRGCAECASQVQYSPDISGDVRCNHQAHVRILLQVSLSEAHHHNCEVRLFHLELLSIVNTSQDLKKAHPTSPITKDRRWLSVGSRFPGFCCELLL